MRAFVASWRRWQTKEQVIECATARPPLMTSFTVLLTERTVGARGEI